MDMDIQPYKSEPDNFFEYRVIYSALGLWCLKSALNEKENKKGISKNAQSMLLHNLANKYMTLCPETRRLISVAKNTDK